MIIRTLNDASCALVASLPVRLTACWARSGETTICARRYDSSAIVNCARLAF
jgi:hypothetical protein